MGLLTGKLLEGKELLVDTHRSFLLNVEKCVLRKYSGPLGGQACRRGRGCKLSGMPLVDFRVGKRWDLAIFNFRGSSRIGNSKILRFPHLSRKTQRCPRLGGSFLLIPL